MTSWEIISFASGETPSAAKASKLSTRDQYLQEQLQATAGHDHDGSTSAVVAAPTETRMGALYCHVQTAVIAANASKTFYLTSDGSSGGASTFDIDLCPMIEVLRGSASSADLQEVGHDTSAASHYYFDFWWDGTAAHWRVQVFNKDPAKTPSKTFWVVAVGG